MKRKHAPGGDMKPKGAFRTHITAFSRMQPEMRKERKRPQEERLEPHSGTVATGHP
jgi:hypothetical protein